MYSIIIVDDELSTRRFLKKYIFENISEFNVIDCFKNGEEAISYIEKNDVDVVLSDIRMPKKNGLELASYIFNNKPYIKMILMSAYNEFEYAKQALTYGVFHYLLKAIDVVELSDTLERIKNFLMKATTSKDDIFVAREKLFFDLMAGEKDVSNEFCDVDILLKSKTVFFQAFEIKFEHITEILKTQWKYGKDAFISAIIRLIDYSFDDLYVIFSKFFENRFIIIVIKDDQFSASVELIIKKWQEGIFELFRLKTDFTCLADNGIYNFFEKDIYALFSKNEITKIKDESQIVNDDTVNKYEDIMKKALIYINGNYQTDISRDDVANFVYYNGAYFARIFKQNIGVSISDYLLDLRMKKAINLISEGKKLSTIFSLVGYNYERQFRRVFSAFTGYSPSDYKKYVLNLKDRR